MKKSIFLLAFFLIHASSFHAQTSTFEVPHSYSIKSVPLLIGYDGTTIEVGAFINDTTYTLIFDIHKVMKIYSPKEDKKTGEKRSTYYVAKGDSLTFFLTNRDSITIYSSYDVSGFISRIETTFQYRDHTSSDQVVYLLDINRINYNISKTQLNALMASRVKSIRLFIIDNKQNRVSIRHKIELKRRKVMQKLVKRIFKTPA